MNSLSPGYTALVIGSSGTIGAAFSEEIAADPSCGAVLSLSRSSCPGFDLRDAATINAALTEVVGDMRPALVIDASGILSVDESGPEKSLAVVRDEALRELMQINAFGPLLLLKALVPLLAKGRCVYGKLSARVGSISDNRLGGWYGYRASKAALNMLLQTAAIELQRRVPHLVVAAMQPGTVVSALSQRFVSASTPTVAAREAASGLLAALDRLPAGPRAHFIDYRGENIPW